MFPSVKKDDSVKGKIREKNWDQRFMVQQGIPQYSPLKDKHAKSYRQLLNTSNVKKQDLTARKQKQTYFQKKTEVMSTIKQSNPTCVKNLKDYQDAMTHAKFPNFYIYYSLLPLLKSSDIPGYVLSELKLIKQQTTPFHRISAAVRARDQCLQRLRKSIMKLKQQQIFTKKNQLKEQISHLRLLTTNVIDQIKIWRQKIGDVQQKPVFYVLGHQNYLMQILNDNKFLFSSVLAEGLNFGEKNDPFLLVPIRRSEGKEASPYLQIIALEKKIEYYKTYMEYLASQKAFQLSKIVVVPQKTTKTGVQKIYANANKQKKKPKNQLEEQEIQQQEDQYKKMQRLKIREERLKKNQQRINSIKSIYETFKGHRQFHSEKKLAVETDDEKKIKQKKTEKKTADFMLGDNQFDSLVKLKVQKNAEKAASNKSSLQKRQLMKKTITKSSSSLPKVQKSQQEMIESLRDIQSSLKNKLSVIQQQRSQLSIKQQPKTSKKTNEEIINELKSQIMSKMQKQALQKEKIKKKKRQQQEKALEQIKEKLIKEIESKLQQKKKQKLIEREELERKLKQEEDRLSNQRQLQLQLQLKLTKERQLRQLEKIKRQALQRQKKFRQQIEQQQRINRQKQQAIQKQRKQKEKLLQQIKRKQLKEQLQKEIKEEIREKNLQKNQNISIEQLESFKKQKQHELTKQIQYLKQKEQVELEQLRKENQLRQRMLKLKQQEEELKRKQVQQMMKKVIQQDKEQMERQADKKRLQIQENLRNNIKEKMLEQYRNDRLTQLELIRQQKQSQIQEDVYRQKVQEKIQKEMRMQAIQRTKKQIQQREGHKFQMRKKLDNLKDHYENNLVIDKNRIEEDVKKDIIEKVIFDKQAEKQMAKNALRSQFERQLMASSIPQIYQNRDSYMLKKTDFYEQDPYLQSKMIAEKPTNDRQPPKQQQQTKSIVKQFKKQMTNEQLNIFSKQKSKISEIREQSIKKPTIKLPIQQQGFQLVKVQHSKKQQEQGFDVKIIRKPKQQSKTKQQYPKKKKKHRNEQQQEDSQEIQKKKRRKQKKKKHKRKVHETESEEDSEDIARRKKSKLKKKKIQESQENSQEQGQPSPLKKKLQFRTSQEQKTKNPKKPQKTQKQSAQRKRQSQSQQNQKNAVVYFDAEQPNLSKLSEVMIKNIKQVQNTSKFDITVEAVPQDQFDQFLEEHFSKLPMELLKALYYNRQQLFRKLTAELTFCLLVGQYEGKVVGMAYAHHDRSRSDCRKFNIVHIGTYQMNHLKDFVLSVTNYIFRKDPCDEVQFHFIFNQSDQKQLQISNDFNKWFDKYGNVYQKKAEQTNHYQRKYVLKRQFNQKCEVILGGINKNTFRNIFSVYSGVIMSNADLIQNKQQLKNVLKPQNEICYTIMISQMFRNFLTPDEAQILKNKVKDFAKLKQILVLVVMMQKKKLKLEQLKLHQYKNLIELNMKLMSQGKEVIRYAKDPGVDMNRIFYGELHHGFNLPFQFQTTSLPVEAKQTQIRQISYFRLTPLPPNKLHIIKSSLYNAEINVIPTQNSKYKLFILNATEYDEIKQQNNLDVFMYVRLFLKNVKSYNVAAWKYVWFPEMTDKGNWSVRQFKAFLEKDIYCHDSINISYRQFLPGALIIQPQHRDLVITPPFIVGVMSMSLQQISQGSPLYARYIDIDALKTLQIQKIGNQQ